MGKIVVLMGATGSGKSTLDNKLRTLSSRVRPITSFTTRKKRSDDKEWDYNYLTKEEFNDLVEGQKLLWHSHYGENLYGTSEESVLEALDSPGKVRIMALTPEVIPNFFNYLKSINKLGDVSFYYINTKDEIRKERLAKRGGSSDAFEKRLQQDTEQRIELFKLLGDKIKVIENNADLKTFLEEGVRAIKEEIPEIDRENKPTWELKILKNARMRK